MKETKKKNEHTISLWFSNFLLFVSKVAFDLIFNSGSKSSKPVCESENLFAFDCLLSLLIAWILGLWAEG